MNKISDFISIRRQKLNKYLITYVLKRMIGNLF